MLHFLIGLALCIWIAERIAHWQHQRQVHKLVVVMRRSREAAERREAEVYQAAQQPEPPTPSPKPLPASLTAILPAPDPEPWRKGCAVIPLWRIS
jgi:hypothetical protein